MGDSASTPQPLQPLALGDAERELLAAGMLGDAGEFAERLVNVLGTDPHALFAVRGECLRVDRDVELPLVGRADHAVAANPPAEKHDRADRPMILAVPLVVRRCPSHLALDD